MGYKANARQAMEMFKRNPRHHKKSVNELRRIYGVSHSFIAKMRREIGWKSREDLKREMDEMIMGHPDFGEPGQPAPCPAYELAEKLGVSPSPVHTRRSRAGVLGYKKPYEPTEIDDEPLPPRQLTWKEKQNYKLCRLANTWKRAEGM